jgi:H+/gluconate symporter-like permease
MKNLCEQEIPVCSVHFYFLKAAFVILLSVTHVCAYNFSLKSLCIAGPLCPAIFTVTITVATNCKE